MNKLFKIFLLILVPVVGITVLIGCNEEDKLTGSIPEGTAVDVSSRITGMDSDITGAGKTLVINGSEFGTLFGLKMDAFWITDYELTNTSITFTVPVNITIGEKDIHLFFDNNKRAATSIDVVPWPAISYFLPTEAKDGDPVTIIGNNLSNAASVTIDGIDATITDQSAGSLTFTFPTGALTDAITITSTEGGITISENEIIACSANSSLMICQEILNPNFSLEESPAGELDDSGWGLGGSQGEAEIVDNVSKHGKNSLLVNVNSDFGDLDALRPWHCQLTTNTINNLEQGETYHLSVWLNGSGISNAMVAVDAGGDPDWTNFEAPEMSLTSGEWVMVEYDFTMPTHADPGTPYGVCRFAISLAYDGNQGGTLYVDELRIVKKP